MDTIKDKEMVWGGSGIEKVVFDFIQKHIPAGSVVVELGSGLVSTRVLSEFYDLYSVEHNKTFVDLFFRSNYIYAPLVDGWYDVKELEWQLPRRELQKLILIDGVNRREILKHMDLFNPDAMYLIHDTYREEEIETANLLGQFLKREVKFYSNEDYFAVI